MSDLTQSIGMKKRADVLTEVSSLDPVDKAIALRRHEFENQTSNESLESQDIQQRVDIINKSYVTGNTAAVKSFIDIEKEQGTFEEIEEHLDEEVVAMGGAIISDAVSSIKKPIIKQTTKKALSRTRDPADKDEEFSLIDEVGRVGGDIIDETFNNVLETGDDLGRWFGLSQAGIVFDSEDFFGTVRWVDDDEMTQLKESGKVTPRIVNIANAPETTGGHLVSGIGQFALAMAAIFKATRTWKEMQLITAEGSKARKILTNNPYLKGEQITLTTGRTNLQESMRLYGAAAFADFLYSPNHGNLSTLIKDFGIENELLNYFDSSPEREDTYLKDINAKMRARIKNVQEGMMLGYVIDGVLTTFKVLNTLRKSVGGDTIIEEIKDKWIRDWGRTVNLDKTQGGETLLAQEARGGKSQIPEKRGEIKGATDKPFTDKVGFDPNTNVDHLKTITESDVKAGNFNSAKTVEEQAFLASKAKEDGIEILAPLSRDIHNLKIESRNKGLKSLSQKKQTKTSDAGISDYTAFRVTASEKDLPKVRQFIKDNFTVLDKELKQHTKVFHYQVLDNTGKFSYEIQVVSDKVAPLIKEQHIEGYGPWKALFREGENTPADDALLKRVTGRTAATMKEIAKKTKEDELKRMNLKPIEVTYE